MKQLERLLVMQGRRCFFCDEPIAVGAASVEHLVASSNGGSNDDENCVVCCKSLNAAFGNKPYKEKLRAVLNHRGKFVCPGKGATSETAGSSAGIEAEDAQVAAVVADLARRGASKPRKEQTLRNTIAAAFQKKLAEEELNSLLARLQDRKYLSITDGKVGYKLPGPDV